MTRSIRGCRRYHRRAARIEVPLPPPRRKQIPSRSYRGAAPGKALENQKTSCPRSRSARMKASDTRSAPPASGFSGSRQFNIKKRISNPAPVPVVVPTLHCWVPIQAAQYAGIGSPAQERIQFPAGIAPFAFRYCSAPRFRPGSQEAPTLPACRGGISNRRAAAGPDPWPGPPFRWGSRSSNGRKVGLVLGGFPVTPRWCPIRSDIPGRADWPKVRLV
jgi:hypothetical protein